MGTGSVMNGGSSGGGAFGGPVEVQVGLVYPSKAMLAAFGSYFCSKYGGGGGGGAGAVGEMDLARLEALVALVLLVQSLVHPFIILAEVVLVFTITELPGRAVMVVAVLEVGLV